MIFGHDSTAYPTGHSIPKQEAASQVRRRDVGFKCHVKCIGLAPL